MNTFMNFVFTLHARERFKLREISEDEVLNTIRVPTRVIKKYDLYYYQRKIDSQRTLEVVVEKTEKNIKIVTAYWI